MQRPRFLSLVSSWLDSSTTTPFDAATPLVGRGLVDVAGRAFEASQPGAMPIAYLTAIVRAYEDDAAAISATRALLADAGDASGTPGLAVVNRRVRPLPDRMGGVVTWGTIRDSGYDRACWATVVLRRGHLLWDVTVTGRGTSQLERMAIDLAADLGGRPQGAWGLWDLLPGTDDLPGPMRVDALFTASTLAAA